MTRDDGYDEKDADRHAESAGGPTVGDELAVLWASGDDAAVYRWLSSVAAPRLTSHIASNFGFQVSDCEDCISAAFDRFHPAVRSRTPLGNPYGYFFKIGINAALALIRQRDTELISDSVDITGLDEETGGRNEPSPDFAVAIVEDAVSELEVEEHWAVEVVRMAVARLPASQRRVAQELMYRDLAFGTGGNADFDYSAADSGGMLGMTAGAFRTAKHRTYEAIRKSVPALIVELGLQPPERAEAVIFPAGRGQFLDDSGL